MAYPHESSADHPWDGDNEALLGPAAEQMPDDGQVPSAGEVSAVVGPFDADAIYRDHAAGGSGDAVADAAEDDRQAAIDEARTHVSRLVLANEGVIWQEGYASLAHITHTTAVNQYRYYPAKGDEAKQHIMMVPGFTAGTASSAPFAREAALAGHPVTVPDQERSVRQEEDPSVIRARGNLAVMKETGAHKGPVTFDIHSEGMLTFKRMLELTQDDPDFDSFRHKDSVFNVRSPSTVNPAESRLRLLTRNLASNASEAVQALRSGEWRNEEFQASTAEFSRNLTSDKARSLSEVRELGSEKADFVWLLRNTAGRWNVEAYADDWMFSGTVLNRGMAPALEAVAAAEGVDAGRLTYSSAVPYDAAGERQYHGHNAHFSDPRAVLATLESRDAAARQDPAERLAGLAAQAPTAAERAGLYPRPESVAAVGCAAFEASRQRLLPPAAVRAAGMIAASTVLAGSSFAAYRLRRA